MMFCLDMRDSHDNDPNTLFFRSRCTPNYLNESKGPIMIYPSSAPKCSEIVVGGLEDSDFF